MAVVLGYPGFWMREPDCGIDWVRVVHGEQRLTLHAPIPAEGTVIGRTRITHVIDKGEGRGALVIQQRGVTDAATGTLLATIDHTTFCRADGGFGGPKVAAPAPHRLPETPPECHCDIATLPQAALIYRLSGTTTRCTPTRRSPARPAIRSRSCTVWRPMAWPPTPC